MAPPSFSIAMVPMHLLAVCRCVANLNPINLSVETSLSGARVLESREHRSESPAMVRRPSTAMWAPTQSGHSAGCQQISCSASCSSEHPIHQPGHTSEPFTSTSSGSASQLQVLTAPVAADNTSQSTTRGVRHGLHDPGINGRSNAGGASQQEWDQVQQELQAVMHSSRRPQLTPTGSPFPC